ncbi:hypothetical protein KPL74_01955 [Bacillus sp. NP157]|nr:hypothetical protein KPL74_01955 [Bacillus sp. NP157]
MLADLTDTLAAPLDVFVSLAESLFPNTGMWGALLASLATWPAAAFIGMMG